MRHNRELSYYFLLVCALLVSYAAYDIRSSYLLEEEKSGVRIANSSLLISERIKGAFMASDYVLRDIISQGSASELRYPPANLARHAQVSALLKAKVQSLPGYVTGANLTDAHCTVTHAYNAPPRPSITGFDGSQREWCTVPQSDPALDTSITHMFLSNTGKLEVGQNRIIRGVDRKFEGIAGFEVELDFFSDWVAQIPIDTHGAVAIIDTQLNLLARNPELPDQMGKQISDARLQSFIRNQESYITFSERSPLDGELRQYGARKVGDLPFIVVAGEANRDWQKAWHANTLRTIGSILLILGLLFYIFRISKKLLQANQIAESTLTEQRQFIAMISHEVRSPMAVIGATAQLLSLHLRDQPQHQHLLQRVQRGVARLSNFFDNCLTQDRVESQSYSLTPVEVDMVELIQGGRDSAESMADGHQLSLQLPDTPVMVSGDAVLLRIAVMNLLANAFKFAPPGSAVTLQVTRHAALCRISVQDQGPGVPVADREVIFQKYRRGAAAERTPGAGLGLAIVKNIIDLHHGRIHVESAPGGGALFVMELPCTAASPAVMQ
jgi:signal transduction histidine kinase